MTSVLNNAGTIELGGAGLADATFSTSTITNTDTLLGHGTVVGNVVNSIGTVSLGSSPSTLNVTGNYSQSGGGTLQIDLASPLSFDKLVVTGSMALGGTLQVTLNNFLPSAGESFDILDWGTLGGNFSSLQLQALANGLAWNTSQLYTIGVLSVMTAGDYNLDGTVDAADYVMWQKIQTVGSYSDWHNNFGNTSQNGNGGQVTGVPESASLTLMFLAAIAWCTRRRSVK